MMNKHLAGDVDEQRAGTPQVTLLIVARDAGAYIGQCLRNALSQSDVSFEVIVVIDPATTDGTQSIATKLAEEGDGPDVRIMIGPESSLAAGWSYGVQQARSPLVVRWDAHGEYPVDFLKASVDAANRRPGVVVGGACLARRDPAYSGLVAELCFAADSSWLLQPARFRRSTAEERNVETLARATYPRDVFVRSGLFRNLPAPCEDTDANYRIVRSGVEFVQMPSIVSHHYCKATIRMLLRQKVRNGAGISALVFASGYVPGWHHAAGALPLLGALACVIPTPFRPVALVILALVCVVGLAVLTSEAIRRKESAGRVPLVLLVVIACHLAFGVGLVFGLGFVRRVRRIPVPPLVI
jgi:succinoglycan biosynthesis protein ExoA